MVTIAVAAACLHSYPYMYAWGEYFNLPSAEVSAEARRAMFHNAPTDAVTRIGDSYVRYSELPSKNLRQEIDKLAQKHCG